MTKPQPVTVNIAGQDYEIEPLTIRGNRAWREKFSQPLQQLLGATRQMVDVFQSQQFELRDLPGLGVFVAVLGQVLLGAPDLVLDMLFAYSPALQADRERIEASAYDDEAMQAFLRILRLAYPFDGLVNLVKQIGQANQATSKS